MLPRKSALLVCPACQGRLQRVARGLMDRLLGLVVPTRRYACTQPGCGWGGLLQGRIQRHGEYRSYRALEAARDAPAAPAPGQSRR